MIYTINNFQRLLFIFLTTLFYSENLSAQIEGANLFSIDQVVNIELDFPQSDFWSQLEDNYTNMDVNGTIYIPAKLTLTDVTGTYTFDSVGVRLKGNSSYGHPGDKKSFKIDFNKYISGQNYDGIKKLNFSNGFKDPTFMREKIFFDISREHGVPCPRANFSTVTYNGEPWGFFTMVEQIDDQFLDWRMLDDNGNLFKAGSNFGGGDGEASLEYLGNAQSAYESSYELKSNENANDWSDLIEFIDFINNTSDSEFETNLGSQMDLGPFLSSAALDNLFGNLDSYTQSARNYYLYHNLGMDKWQWIKWDGNEAFGSYGFMGPLNPSNLDIYYYASNRPLLERVYASQILKDQYTSEVCLLINTIFNPDYLNPMIDDLKELIKNDVYADNNKMFSNTDFDTNIESDLSGGGGGPGPGGSIEGLKSFIQQRYNYLLTAIDCEPFAGITAEEINDISIYPNPSDSKILIEGIKTYPATIKIKALNGVLIHAELIYNTAQYVDISHLSPNLYFLELESQVIKLIKK
ncbi:CotH kinase family protein [Crocinitomicaceae bacterium]|nr:CotH kinase family protein [Crocinitomicaceae bacterium]